MSMNKKFTEKEDFQDDSILYELLEYFVKKQDPELVKCKNDAAILPNTGTIKNALRYLNNRYSLPESISQQLGLTLPWKFAVGDDGRLLAILQENVIEIRKSKDEYSSIVGKASVPKDAFPQWRKIVWSPDASILVLASSNGYLSFYSSLGNNLFNISPKTMSQNPEILEAGDAIASMIFSKPKKEREIWTHEFISITYSGLLKSYRINGTQSYIQNYEFSYGNFYRNGVNAFAYDSKHNLYLVAGNNITQHLNAPASDTGLTSWRPLNDYPHFKLSVTFDQDSTSQSKFSLWNFVPKFRAPPEPVIFRISVSPCCNNLVCLHTDGAISLWTLPNLRLQKKWSLIDQPDHNAPNPLGIPRFKKFPPGLSEFCPMDIGWWSENAIIIARYSGSISVCSIKDLRNLLGTCPEFLSGQPQISELSPNCGFLCLDCETFITSKKRNRESNSEIYVSEASSESEKDDDEVEPLTIVNYTTSLVQSALYSITDIEKFQPKRKKSKILQRTYRILGLKSTTPEELYSRKIDIEEYEEALTLANTYNLDTDLVYQTQWRKSQFSLNDIQEHLGKVSKRSWVLNECMTRVPESLEAARELLNFGLKGANLETLLAIGEKDDGKFVADKVSDDWESLNQVDLNLREVQRVNEIINKIDLKNLSGAQKDLIRFRRKLLDHLDKLQTYQIILEDPQKYKKEFYEEFRQLTAVENAVRFAKDGNCEGVGIMFTYHGHQLMPHWLAIISWFPETLNPSKYEKLLPECDTDGQLFLLFQRELRPKDWSEKMEFIEAIDSHVDDGSQFLYDSDPSLSAYRNTELTPELLTKWYKTRAYKIERDCCIIDNALELIRIGKSHNINGLETLLMELETLDDLVYKVYVENMSLAQLEKLSDLEKVQLLMSTSNEDTFVADIKNYVLPFARRKVKYLGGEFDKRLFQNYLLALSEKDLTKPAKLFESLKHAQNSEIMTMVDDVISLALDCIYACTETDMYDRAQEIFESLPKSNKNVTESESRIENLEREIIGLKILNKYDVQTTVRYIHGNKSKEDEVKIILNEMAMSLNKPTIPPDENAWTELLNDILELHDLIFGCIDIEVCFEICVSARLASSIKINIQNCANLIETKKNDQSLLKVSYDRAVTLILEASKEYFNSSKTLIDYNMELAKACLHLITDENPVIKEEFELINSLQILDEFNINILPLQVRSCQDRLKLIENCLESRRDAYKRQQRLLTLASYLRIEGKNKRLREGKILQLIAEKAFELGDYDVCAATCQQLIDTNYYPAWKITQKLGFCDDFQDLPFRQKILRFSICYGSTDILEKTLTQMHLLEIQMLNKSLERWMMEHDIENFEDAGNSDDEFTDAMTTPQVEVKDFVPKIIEASSGIVKSSAQLVKQSTIGVIKNFSNKNFWSTALKPSSESDESLVDEREIRRGDLNADLQSFPCFYEFLHEKCRVGNTEPKYTRYSTTEIHDGKLKLCQILLRVATLSETACYGLEVSDISHFFLQSAKHILPEDCLLGLSYLLSLRDNNSSSVEEVFRDLPNNQLYNQLAAYYYALESYRETNSKIGKVDEALLYDPIDLIKMMLSKARKLDETEESKLQKALISWGTYLSNTKKYEIEDGEEADVSSNCSVESPETQEIDEIDDEDDKVRNERLNDHETFESKTEIDNVNDKPLENVEKHGIPDSLNDIKNKGLKIEPKEKVESGWDDNWEDYDDFESKTEIDDVHDEAAKNVEKHEIPEPSNLKKTKSFEIEPKEEVESGWDDNWEDHDGFESKLEIDNVHDEAAKNVEKHEIPEPSNLKETKSFNIEPKEEVESGWDDNWEDHDDFESKTEIDNVHDEAAKNIEKHEIPESSNLYENESFKVEPKEEIESGWDDTWEDNNEFESKTEIDNVHDEADKNIEKHEIPEPSNLCKTKTFKTEPNAEVESGWDDNWGDFSDPNEESIVIEEPIIIEEINPIPVDTVDKSAENEDDLIPGLNCSEEERFKIFDEILTDSQTREQLSKIKKILLHWPPFTQPEFLTIEKNPMIRTLLLTRSIISVENNRNFEMSIVEEYQSLLKAQPLDQNLLTEFLQKHESGRSLQENIYLRLLSTEPESNEEAVSIIKTHKITELAVPIMEELFFKNLTAQFPPHSKVYDKILEQMFLNHDIPEIEDNIRILIEKLIRQKHLPYAVGLLSQLEKIPAALATFESCFELLVRK